MAKANGLKGALLKALAVPHEDVEVGGVTVRVSGLSAADQLELAERSDDMGPAEVTFWMLARTMRDPKTGDRLFDDGDESLHGLDGNALTVLAETARKLSSTEARAKN